MNFSVGTDQSVPMYVYRFGCPPVTGSMERDGINWAKEKGLSIMSYFPNHKSKPSSCHTDGCHAAKFAPEH